MANPIQGTQEDDTLYGTAGNDRLIGHRGNDVFDLTDSLGTDTVNGQGGLDVAIFGGRLEDYIVEFKDTGNLKTTVIGADLTAELKHIETIYFDNATYDVVTRTALVTTVSVADAASVNEGDAGAQLQFTLNRTGDLSRSLDVVYTLGGTATAGADYTAPASYTVHFEAGSATAILTLAVTNDTAVEGAESVSVNLVADTHYNFAAGAQISATGTITDNDAGPVLPVLHISNATAREGGTLVFRVSIDAPTDHAITFNARTSTGLSFDGTVNFGTATPGNQPNGDFNGFPATSFTIAAGQTFVDIPVFARSDGFVEGSETFSLRLSDAVGATIGSGVGFSRGVGTIEDVVQTRVSYYADANNVVEGNDLVFYFHRDVTSEALDVRYWINTFPGGGAVPGEDFTADGTTFTFVSGDPGSSDFMTQQDHWADASMVVHFAAGQSDATLVLHTTNDGLEEQFGEAFAVQFDFSANASNIIFDGARSETDYLTAYPGANPTQVNIGHIVDQPIVTLVQSELEGFEGDAFIFTALRTGDLSSTLTVNYVINGTDVAVGGSGFGTPGLDYIRDPETGFLSLTFAAGSATADITVQSLTDNVAEGDEVFQVIIAGGLDYTAPALGTAATGVIHDLFVL